MVIFFYSLLLGLLSDISPAPSFYNCKFFYAFKLSSISTLDTLIYLKSLSAGLRLFFSPLNELSFREVLSPSFF